MTEKEKHESDKAIRDFVYDNNNYHSPLNDSRVSFNKTIEVFDKNNNHISTFNSTITVKDHVSSGKAYVVIESDKIKEVTDKEIYWPTTNKCTYKNAVLIIQNANNTIIIS